MLNFTIDAEKCTRCGLCAADCPARIIALDADKGPSIDPANEASCFKCQHCLAICPAAAISILGIKPEDCLPLSGALPQPDRLEALIRGRRSVRRYKDENLDPSLLRRLLDVAWHAPTGVNTQQVRFTVIDDKAKLARLRDEIMARLAGLVREGALPERLSYFAGFVRLWDENRVDTLFRGAPHLIVASAPATVPTPAQDCMIALSYFELFAQANGVGTVWDGLATIVFVTLLPHLREGLGIPDDHQIGFTMAFGPPAVRYARTVCRGPADVSFVR